MVLVQLENTSITSVEIKFAHFALLALLWAQGCAPSGPSNTSEVCNNNIITNFEYSLDSSCNIVHDSTTIEYIEGFNQLYIINSKVYYVNQVSSNNFIIYDHKNDTISNRFGFVYYYDNMVFSLSETPLIKVVRSLDLSFDIEIDSLTMNNNEVYMYKNGIVVNIDTVSVL